MNTLMTAMKISIHREHYSSGYINDGSVDFDDKEYEGEIYNFGQAVKQK